MTPQAGVMAEDDATKHALKGIIHAMNARVNDEGTSLPKGFLAGVTSKGFFTRVNQQMSLESHLTTPKLKPAHFADPFLVHEAGVGVFVQPIFIFKTREFVGLCLGCFCFAGTGTGIGTGRVSVGW
jgi:hypothetical protein